MERLTARSVAAILAGIATISCLIGISEIARFESKTSELPVIVLERVEIVASRPGSEQPILADSSTDRKGR